jgi:hypothetical protein
MSHLIEYVHCTWESTGMCHGMPSIENLTVAKDDGTTIAATLPVCPAHVAFIAAEVAALPPPPPPEPPPGP